MKDMNIPYIAGLVIRAQHSDSDAFAELYALTYNKVYNYTRHYLRDDFLAQDAMQDANPELHYQQKDEYSRLADALEQLPFNEKQVLIMRYYNDMKLEEIAAAMEISRSSVKRYIASGQDHLKERMKG